jgi:hypothetical protein
MLKNVAGGRSAPGMKSPEASATVSSAANEPDVAQTLVERISPATNANEPSFRNCKRGVMDDVPCVRNAVNVLSVDLPSQSVIGTKTAALAAYAELKRAGDEGNVGKAVNRGFTGSFKIERSKVTIY